MKKIEDYMCYHVEYTGPAGVYVKNGMVISKGDCLMRTYTHGLEGRMKSISSLKITQLDGLKIADKS